MRALKFLIAFVVACSGLILGSCTWKGAASDEVEVIQAASILESNESPKEKAEKLAVDAEKLLEANGYLEAFKMVQLALGQDPENLRAGFLNVTLKPMILLKGIYTRIKPLVEKHEELLKAYTKAMNSPKTPAKDFLMDGEEDLITEAQFQEKIDELIEAFEALRVFARDHRHQDLTIKSSSYFVPNVSERYVSACYLDVSDDGVYKVICPPRATRFHVSLNEADFESLESLAAYGVIYLSLAGAYDLSGGADVMKKLYHTSEGTPQAITDALLKNPRFGTLRKQSQLRKVKEMGLDLIRGLRWFEANQKSVCPKGMDSFNRRQRPGMLFDEGVCFSSQLNRYIDIAEDFFHGRQLKAMFANGKTYEAQHRGILFFTQPIQDVRSLGPIRMNRCSQITDMVDQTLNGVFPDGDLLKVLPAVYPDCQE